MAEIDVLLEAIDGAVWEVSEVFEGLEDRDVWRRADPRLLSVGELAMHVCFGSAQSFLGSDFSSDFVVDGARYYPVTVAEPIGLDMGADAVYDEVKRVHAACRAAVLEINPDLESKSPFREGWTWKYVLQYMAFHISYHVGQMYSVRHLMGHETNNN